MSLSCLLRVVGLGTLLASNAAVADDDVGWKVGLASAGGELGGMLVGGGLGLAWGANICATSQSWECYAPVITTPLVGIAGGLAGAVSGAGWSARRLDRDHRKVRRWTLAAGATGLGVSILGVALNSEELMLTGAVSGAVSMPIVAGAVAGRGPSVSATAARRVQVDVSPTVSLDGYGVRVAGRF